MHFAFVLKKCVFYIDCQKCFHNECLCGYQFLQQTPSSLPSSGASSESNVQNLDSRFTRMLSGDSATDYDFITPDLTSIDNCSFYSTAPSVTSSTNVVSLFSLSLKSYYTLIWNFTLICLFFTESKRLVTSKRSWMDGSHQSLGCCWLFCSKSD